MKKKKMKLSGLEDNYNLINKDTPFAVREAFGLLRTNILYSPKKGEGASVYGVASVGERSGKSTVISNLAYSFAQSQKKVLFIDADMRCPVQHKFFGYDKDASGFSEILSGIVADPYETIIKTDNEYLNIIPSGHIPPNPSELVLSSKLGEFMGLMKKEYDYIFIDFPPVAVVPDAVSMVNYVDGYIFVIRANVTDKNGIKECIDNIENVGGTVVGIVLDDVNHKEGMFGVKYTGKYGKYNRYSKYSRYNRYNRYARSATNSSKTKE